MVCVESIFKVICTHNKDKAVYSYKADTITYTFYNNIKTLFYGKVY